MEIAAVPAANSDRQAIETLLISQGLPVRDLPSNLERFWVVVDKGMIIGVAGIELYQSFGLLRSLAVLPGYRDLGIGSTLIRTIEGHAAGLHLGSIYLLTETAELYFEKKGYTVVERAHVPDGIKRSSEFSHVCPVSAVVMQKKIAER